MLVVKLWGGLGNQLFQYALGRRLALEHDVTLKLDDAWYRDDTKTGTERYLTLTEVDIDVAIATDDDLRSVVSLGGIPVSTTRARHLARLSEAVGPLPSSLTARLSARLFDYYREVQDGAPPGRLS